MTKAHCHSLWPTLVKNRLIACCKANAQQIEFDGACAFSHSRCCAVWPINVSFKRRGGGLKSIIRSVGRWSVSPHLFTPLRRPPAHPAADSYDRWDANRVIRKFSTTERIERRPNRAPASIGSGVHSSVKSWGGKKGAIFPDRPRQLQHFLQKKLQVLKIPNFRPNFPKLKIFNPDVFLYFKTKVSRQKIPTG